MHENLEFFYLLTLVDITRTDVTRSTEANEHERNQQRNWETVLQVLGIRAQPTVIAGPITDTISEDMVRRLFGEMYHGRDQRIWAAGFCIEHRDVYQNEHGQLGRLVDDFNKVPIIAGLNETARFILPIFYCEGALKNIEFFEGTLGT